MWPLNAYMHYHTGVGLAHHPRTNSQRCVCSTRKRMGAKKKRKKTPSDVSVYTGKNNLDQTHLPHNAPPFSLCVPTPPPPSFGKTPLKNLPRVSVLLQCVVLRVMRSCARHNRGQNTVRTVHVVHRNPKRRPQPPTKVRRSPKPQPHASPSPSPRPRHAFHRNLRRKPQPQTKTRRSPKPQLEP